LNHHSITKWPQDCLPHIQQLKSESRFYEHLKSPVQARTS